MIQMINYFTSQIQELERTLLEINLHLGCILEPIKNDMINYFKCNTIDEITLFQRRYTMILNECINTDFGANYAPETNSEDYR